MLPMPSALEAMLRQYLEHQWKPNPSGLLFPNAKGTHPRWRDNVVKYGLKLVLKKLGIPTKDTGLHAFRHGLANLCSRNSSDTAGRDGKAEGTFNWNKCSDCACFNQLSN
jgi:integrase